MKRFIIIVSLFIAFACQAQTHRISILNSSTKPDVSGDVFQAPFTYLGPTNGIHEELYFHFNDTAVEDTLWFKFKVPKNYASGAGFVLTWTDDAGSGNFEGNVYYRAVAATETADFTTFQESLGTTDASNTAFTWEEFTVSATDGNLAAEDMVIGCVTRDGAGSDTIAGTVILGDLEFEFSE